MSVNHHLLAKATTDSVLAKFKAGIWKCVDSAGRDFYRVGTDSTFPSPDAAFYDDDKKLMVSFEFKPPTETKRGILTGLGQSIAYLNSSNLSYLIIPRSLEDYRISDWMTDLFATQIRDQLPIGLIVYQNDAPTNVELVHNVLALKNREIFKAVGAQRFWAKHLDMPIPLFHLILHCYYLKKAGSIDGDAFSYCWTKYMVPNTVLKTLTPATILDVNGDPILTPAGRKKIAFLEKKIASIRKLSGAIRGAAVAKLRKDVATDFVGDNYYNSIKKNFVTFLKHIGVVDSTGSLTELGFKLYHLGLVNGPSSKIFYDYFTQIVLTLGHHLDLIFDFDNLCNIHRGSKTIAEIRSLMMKDYESRGMIKRNPNRIAAEESSVDFLKYEFILWNSLDLTVKTGGKPEISFNWKRITEVCSLPDL